MVSVEGGLPTGTVTFLFTDLEGSTRLWEERPEAMHTALARHDEIVREAIEGRGGTVVKTTGDGAHAAFPVADAAIAAAVDAQVALGDEHWEATGPLRVRMGVHTGPAEQRAGDYFGPALNRAARLASVAHGGQVVVSQATADLARDALPRGYELVDLGEHRLRDLSRAEHLFQVGAGGLQRDFPRLRSLDAFPGNLPIARTALIGRRRALRRLAQVLAEHRLVTLTGVGGVGKTRLAVQLAADVLDRFPDGAWLVALESIRDPVLVPSVVAAALEIAERPGRPVTETLRDAIGSRELLVVLDNCEHLLDASARLVDGLLDACAGLRVVATSREALGVEGEQSWPTPSLGLPDAGSDLEEVAWSDAVALFVERARAVRPEFELSPANAAAVTALCARLDGIPLAIELAAARISALSSQEILERVDQRFLLLTGGSRTALERHQTLQAAVDWSYDLLDETERRFFARLSVFAGGFTLDAARAVAADENTAELVVLDLVDSLVAKSMVLAEGSDASVRYRLLETLRQYARDRLAATGDAATTRARHARYYLEFVEALRPSIFGPRQLAAWDREATELGNLRAGFNWMLETGDGAGALQLAGALFGGGGTDTGELLRLRLAALDAAAALPPGERVEPLAWTAFAAVGAGEHTRARELAEASLACAHDANIAPHPRAFETLGLVAFWRSEPTLAVENLERSVAQARQADDGSVLARWWIASSRLQLCFVLGQTGEAERAIAAGEEALSSARQLGMPTLVSGVLFNLALAYRSTDPRRAARLIDESLERSVSIGARWPYQRGWTLIAAGQVHGTLGEHDRALGAFAEVLNLARQSGERFFVPLALQGIARALRHRHRPDQATRLLAASQHLAQELDIPGGPADLASRDRAFTRLRELLGPERFDTEVETGTALSFDAALTTGIDIATAAQDAVRPSPTAAPTDRSGGPPQPQHS
jgi:predicted ATPase/class 3 adenylate cyclase